MSVNKCIFIGHLGKDPETRYSAAGEAVTSCSIAITEKWKDKAGAKHEKTEWINLTFFKKLAEIAGEYLKKGSQIYVEGKMTTQKWQDKEGKDRYTTSIIVNDLTMLGGGNTEKSDVAERTETTQNKPVEQKITVKGFENFDDDPPF